ncbi:hypothetical protein [Sessilibacter corallicola]|uniref:hypothetical protein n=1 Tax=Sessilibacter corallicola TaxID=2904075 RepID=UPI001E310D0B|nr:hypothetical protein [Sessilibacter corallicola]MCE2028815.1 hypothetical protein [Sessilibacter corallicola]
MNTSKLLLPLVLTLGVGLIGCGSESSDDRLTASVSAPEVDSHTETVDEQSGLRLGRHYLKPGAAVLFDHDYDGKTDVSEQELVNVQILPSFNMETLRVRITSVDGIMVGGDISFQGPAIGQQPVNIPVLIQSGSEGRYYLNVMVDSMVKGDKQSRSFALPIVVGDAPISTKSSQIVESNGELIRVMPATENP